MAPSFDNYLVPLTIYGPSKASAGANSFSTALPSRRSFLSTALDSIFGASPPSSPPTTQAMLPLIHDKLELDTGTPRPTLLVVYGSYGVCLSEGFKAEYSVMLRRGWNIAFAHVR